MFPIPSTSQTLLFFLLLTIVTPVLCLLYNISPFHPLSLYPGPLLWRVTRMTWIIALQRGNMHRDLKTLHDRYGPVVRIAPNELSYIDARAWKDIYASSGGNRAGSGAGGVFERNGTWFKKSNPDEAFSVMGHDETSHAKQRRALMPAFTDKAVGEQGPIVQGQVDLFIDQLRLKARAGKKGGEVDLVAWFNFLLFDISGLLTFGESFESTANGKAHPWVAISSKFGKGVALRVSLNFLGTVGRGLGVMMGLFLPKEVAAKIAYHMALSRELVQKKLYGENKDRRADFLDATIRYNAAEKGEKVSDKEMEITASILIFAGAETTASALSGIMSYLLLPENNGVLQHATNEIRERFASADSIKSTSVADFPYLDALINEGLRLSPPVAIGVPRVVPKGGAVVAERFVPEGTYVTFNQFPANHSSFNFTDADKFEPERFMVSRDGDKDSAFNPFSIGRHQCLGMRLAWLEMRLILARLLHEFDMEAVETGGGKTWSEQKTFIFWEKEPLMVRLKSR